MEKKFKSLMDMPIIAATADADIWKFVSSSKRAFIDDDIIPAASEYIPQEVIDSWVVSKNNGIDPQMPWPPPTLMKDELDKVLEENRQLINATIPFFECYNKILEVSEYNMVLYDANGIILTYVLKRPHEDISVGGIRNELVVGTTAHNMTLRYKRPVQIIGPVNYCKALETNITSAAPIFNEYDELLGSIVLYQINASGMWLLGHNLGWITSTAMAISSQLRLYRRDIRLKVMDETFKAALAHSKDAFISIDKAGHIINFNKEAAKLMKIKYSKTSTTFFKMLKDPSPVKHALKTGLSSYNQQLVFISDDTSVNADIEPFLSETQSSGAVIKIIRSRLVDKGNVTFDNIIHKSAAMVNLISTAAIVAKNPINVLLLGESGTGKELFAQAIHNAYGSGPFVAINCASMPVNLIESELFGYERGAFTGADSQGRKGKIEHANGGTLFLDEIGDMPLELQPVLLRVLEEKKVVRVGGHKSIPVNFRIISATNRSLFDDVKNKLFRGDLYFRLSVVNLEIPPLRERDEDLLLLAEEFIDNICANFELPPYTLAQETKNILMEYDWPGNVRQLENAMTYAISFAKNQLILPENLPKEVKAGIQTDGLPGYAKLSELKDMEIQILRKAVSDAGNMEKAAKKLGISRSTLYRKLKG